MQILHSKLPRFLLPPSYHPPVETHTTHVYLTRALFSMESLPLEILERVCEYLGLYEANRQSLHQFASASTFCRAVAAKARYSCVSLNVRSSMTLQSDIEHLIDMFTTNHCLRHIRKLRISGDMSLLDLDTAEGNSSAFPSNLATPKYPQENQGDINCDPFSDLPGMYAYHDYHPQQLSDEDQEELELAWAPLSELIVRLALSDLIWAAMNQVPLSLLSTLHNRNLECRLHVHTFCLRSMIYFPAERPKFTEAEYALVTSPCLYSIYAPDAYWFDSLGRNNYNQEAVHAMVSGITPNLKKVQIDQTRRVGNETLHAALQRGRPVWTGFYPDKHPSECMRPVTRGKLQVLKIREFGLLNEDVVSWSVSIDLDLLKSLSLDINRVQDGLRGLAELAQKGAFRSLADLSISWSDFVNEFTHPTDFFVDLVSSLSPLKSLQLGWTIDDPSIDAILETHGDVLCEFRSSDMVWTRHQVARIGSQCTQLRDLTVEIQRTGGDAEEVRTYQSLGTIGTLRRLTLGLHCESPESRLTSPVICYHGAERNMSIVPLIRRIFANAAIDDVLARSIYNIVSLTQAGSHLAYHSALEELTIRVQPRALVVNSREYSTTKQFIRWLGRTWLCERFQDHPAAVATCLNIRSKPKTEAVDLGAQETIATVSNHHVKLRELEKKDRQAVEHKFYFSGETPGKFDDKDAYKKAWNELWPNREGNWLHNWHSFPLEATEEDHHEKCLCV